MPFIMCILRNLDITGVICQRGGGGGHGGGGRGGGGGGGRKSDTRTSR